jgi:hypothetical protein
MDHIDEALDQLESSARTEALGEIRNWLIERRQLGRFDKMTGNEAATYIAAIMAVAHQSLIN